MNMFELRYPDGDVDYDADRRPVVKVEDDDEADHALKLSSDIDADLLSLETRKAAMMAQFDRMEKRILSRRKEWQWKYEQLLIEYARRKLAGKKVRSLVLPHGTVSFRNRKALVRVIDQDEAVAWAERHGYHAYIDEEVVTKRFIRKEAALSALKLYETKLGHKTMTPPWLEIREAADTPTVETAVAGMARAMRKRKPAAVDVADVAAGDDGHDRSDES